MYSRIPEHECSKNHKLCYMNWRTLQSYIATDSTVNKLLTKQLKNESEMLKNLLKRLLDVTLFIAELGLAFRGSSHLIDDPKNGNFLGMLELLSHYDPLLSQYLEKVKKSQQGKSRLQFLYLSNEIQNEFISCCAQYVLKCIMLKRDKAKYFLIMVDATPDSAHIEQTTFILRYVAYHEDKNEFEVIERLLEFVNCNDKTGEAIAELILLTLLKNEIPISDCRGQGYDNGSNMNGTYKGVQARLLNLNPLALFSPCACHSLNLCGVQAAESCSSTTLFFGVIQKLYNIFSSSPLRWEILKSNINGDSLHSTSKTRWSARIECVKPFVKHSPASIKAIEKVLELNLTPETKADLMGIRKYMQSIESIAMGLWGTFGFKFSPP